MADIARDHRGRDVSKLARLHSCLPRRYGFGTGLGGDPGVMTWLVNEGMSVIDARFIMDFDAIDKSVLIHYIANGMSPYDALTSLYDGHPYIPNVDKPPLPTYRPPAYAPLPGYPQVQPTGVAAPTVDAHGNQVANGTPTSTAKVTPSTTAIPTSIAGIPILYWVLGAGAVWLLTQ
jgi:hypothetical protein